MLLIIASACTSASDHLSAAHVIERFEQEELPLAAMTDDLQRSEIVSQPQLRACGTGRAFGEPIERGGYPLYFRAVVLQCPDHESAQALAATVGRGPDPYLRANRVVVHKNIVLIIQQDGHLWSVTERYAEVQGEM